MPSKPKPAKIEPETSTDDGETVEFEFRGEAFAIPKDRDDWPTMAMMAFARGNNNTAIEIVLGPEQWNRAIQAAPKFRDFVEFAETFADVQRKECVGG